MFNSSKFGAFALRVTILAFAGAIPAVGFSTPGGSGGGDPRAAGFLSGASAACEWMGTQDDLRAKKDQCLTELADIQASLDDTNREPRVYSDFVEVYDNGTPKDAVTDIHTRRVHINIPRWEAESTLEQRVTAGMEMALLVDAPGRYTLGKRFTTEFAQSLSTGTGDSGKWASHMPAEFEKLLALAGKSKSCTLSTTNYTGFGVCVTGSPSMLIAYVSCDDSHSVSIWLEDPYYYFCPPAKLFSDKFRNYSVSSERKSAWDELHSSAEKLNFNAYDLFRMEVIHTLNAAGMEMKGAAVGNVRTTLSGADFLAEFTRK